MKPNWKEGAKLYRLRWTNAAQTALQLKDGGVAVLGQLLPLLKAVRRMSATSDRLAPAEEVIDAYMALPEEWREMVEAMSSKDDANE